MNKGEQRWYVVHTRPNLESRAAIHLKRQGFGIYLPRYSKIIRHARRTSVISAPLFPRYFFVAIDILTQRWRAIHGTQGVKELICSGDMPTEVAPTVIEDLKRRENDHGFVQLNTLPRFTHGEKVRIIDGAFSNCLALFDTMTDSERVAVLLDLLGRKVRMVMRAEAIEAL